MNKHIIYQMNDLIPELFELILEKLLEVFSYDLFNFFVVN